MPTRKQRRRRAKERRHEYEYVYVDEEGQEVEVDGEPDEAEHVQRRNGKAARPATRGGRVVEPPSWRRVGRRALLFAPLMFLALSLVGSSLTINQRVIQTMLMLAFFLPFSYLMDRMLYRSHLRRSAGGEAPRRRR
jgi:hypothetical protein